MFKKHSKIIAIFLALTLVFSMCCMSAMALDRVAYNTEPVNEAVHAGDTATLNFYLSYPEKFEGIQFMAVYSDNLAISPNMYLEDEETYGDTEKMMPNVKGSNFINLNPVDYVSTILANNMNAQPGNKFAEETLLFTCDFDVIADGEAKISVVIQEMYNTDDTWCDPSQVVLRTELNVQHNETSDPTSPITEPETDPETEPETEPKTDPATAPETEPQTEPGTDASEPSTEPTEPTPSQDWYVVGVADLCNGENWVTGAEVNKMTLNPETGLYEITFEQVGEGASEDKPFAFQFKVSSCTGGSWENGESYPDANINGYISAQDDVKVTYNPETHEVLWDSASKFTPTNHTYRVAGATDLCGSSYDPYDDNNVMTYNEETKRWEKVYENLPKNDVNGYKFKITMDGSTWYPDGTGNDQIFYTGDEVTTVTIWYDAATGMWGIDSDSENVETEFVDMPTAATGATDEPTEVPTEAPTDEPTEAAPTDATEAPTDAPTAAPTDEPTEAPSEDIPVTDATDTPSEDVPVTDASEAPSEDSSDVPATDASETPTEAGSSSATPNTNGTKPTAPSATTPTTTNPPSSTGKVATGDSTSVAALMIVLMAAAGVVVLARKRIKD